MDRFTVLFLLLLLVPAAPAAGQEMRWRVISGDGAYATSGCIGSNETVDCLVDTMVACPALSRLPNESIDGSMYDHFICFAKGMNVALSLVPPGSQTLSNVLHFYGVHYWTLTDDDIWRPEVSLLGDFGDPGDSIPRYQGTIPRHTTWFQWRTGDTVADMYVYSCEFSSQCVAALPARLGAKQVLTLCAPTHCIWPFGGVVDDGPLPYASIILRQENDGWHVVDGYHDGMVGSTGYSWRPDRYRK